MFERACERDSERREHSAEQRRFDPFLKRPTLQLGGIRQQSQCGGDHDDGIEAGRGVYPPLHDLSRQASGRFAGAERARQTLVSIPLYPALTDDEVTDVLASARRILVAA